MKSPDPNQAWRIELQCPQCGALVDLEETDRILQCVYCRTRLYLAPKGHGVYYLQPDASTKDFLFIPYWRFKGMVFSCEEREIAQRVEDSTLLAMKVRELPPSLGVRPQVLKLRFVTPEIEGAFFKPHFPLKIGEKGSQGDGDCSGTGRSEPFELFIGETVSLIYAPLYMREGILYDAILKRPLARTRCDLAEKLPLDHHHSLSVQFIPTLCPHCGWDLLGEKDTLILLCKNCNTAWKASGDGLARLEFGVMDCGVEEPTLCLPFWRLGTRVKGLQLESYADLIRLANLPKAIKEEWFERRVHFWTPAFKVQPHLFMRLSKFLTIAQPHGELEAAFPKVPTHPVTLPLKEAVESVKLTIASLGVPKSHIIPMLSDIEIKLEACHLVYLPFTSVGSELIQPTIQMGINKNSLKMGRLL